MFLQPVECERDSADVAEPLWPSPVLAQVADFGLIVWLVLLLAFEWRLISQSVVSRVVIQWVGSGLAGRHWVGSGIAASAIPCSETGRSCRHCLG